LKYLPQRQLPLLGRKASLTILDLYNDAFTYFSITMKCRNERKNKQKVGGEKKNGE